MKVTILCNSCGQFVPVPEGYGRRRVLCPQCGVICDVPATTKEAVYAPFPTSPEPRIEGSNEDDGKPYGVSGDSEQTAPCPNCKKPVRLGAIVCNRCGFDRETGTTHQRVFEKVDKQWESGLAFRIRFGIFLSVQALAIVAMLVVAFAEGNLGVLALWWLVGGALLAYVLGTSPRINLTRSKKGRVRLTKTWRFCFILLGATEIPWREFENVTTIKSCHDGFSDWFIALILLLFAIIPGVLWWIFIIKPDHFDVNLTRDHGGSGLLLHRGGSEAMAKEIAAAIRNVTGLL